MTYRGAESPIHKAVLAYLRLALPGAVIHHAANGIALGGSPIQRARAVSKAKAEGMLVGYPDLTALWRDPAGAVHFYAFEVKPEGRKPTDEQTAVGKLIEANGGRWAVVRSVTDAEDCIREWRGAL